MSPFERTDLAVALCSLVIADDPLDLTAAEFGGLLGPPVEGWDRWTPAIHCWDAEPIIQRRTTVDRYKSS